MYPNLIEKKLTLKLRWTDYWNSITIVTIKVYNKIVLKLYFMRFFLQINRGRITSWKQKLNSKIPALIFLVV